MVLSFAPGWWTPREMCGCPMPASARAASFGKRNSHLRLFTTGDQAYEPNGTRPNCPATFLKYVVGLSNLLLNYFEFVDWPEAMDVGLCGFTSELSS